MSGETITSTEPFKLTTAITFDAVQSLDKLSSGEKIIEDNITNY